MIQLLVFTDGRRNLITQTIPSALASLQGPITHRVIHDDSGDDEYREWLAQQFPTFEIIGGGPRLGFAGAIAKAWHHALSRPEAYVFHLEDDFTFNRPVSLTAMAEVLRAQPNVAQLALRRQPWSEAEFIAGGVVEQHPEAYEETSLWAPRMTGPYAYADTCQHPVLLHRLFFTTNPSLYRRTLCERQWPQVARSEGHFTHRLLADPDLRFGYWGARSDEPWTTHIGADRNGSGY